MHCVLDCMVASKSTIRLSSGGRRRNGNSGLVDDDEDLDGNATLRNDSTLVLTPRRKKHAEPPAGQKPVISGEIRDV